MEATPTTINGTNYQTRALTRGQVREITALAGEEQSDRMVELTLGGVYAIDSMPMPDYVAIVQWAIAANGLDGNAIAAAKKN